MKLDEATILANADYLYNVACNKDDLKLREFCERTYGGSYAHMYPEKFDRTIGPRSTKAAISAIVRGINEMLEKGTEVEQNKLANSLLDEMMA